LSDQYLDHYLDHLLIYLLSTGHYLNE